MSRQTTRIVATALAALATALAFAGTARAADDVSVAVDRANISTRLGNSFSFRTRIANRGAAATGPLVAHLNILSLKNGVYVDPEDWSSRRTVYLDPLRSGASRTITWTMKAVNSGSFATYVAVLPRLDPDRRPATGRAVHVAVAERRTINSGGILPLAVGIPFLIGLLAAGVHIARRRMG